MRNRPSPARQRRRIWRLRTLAERTQQIKRRDTAEAKRLELIATKELAERRVMTREPGRTQLRELAEQLPWIAEACEQLHEGAKDG